MRGLMTVLLPFCAAMAACVLCALPPIWAAGIAVLAASLGGLSLRFAGKRGVRAALCLFGICAGLLWYGAYQILFCRSAEAYDGMELELTAAALDAPVESRHGCAVLCEIRLDGRRYRARLYLDEGAPKILPGDRICGTMKLTLTPQLPSEDDTLYFRSRGVWFTASMRGAYQVKLPACRSLRDLPALAALELQQKIAELFDRKSAGFLTALLTGSRTGMDFAVRNALSVSGIYHTIAVSGMHVSILIGMILLLCGTRKRLAAAIGVPVVVFFVLLTGAPASGERAGVMQILLLLAPLVKREYDPPTALSVALALLMAEDPWSVYNVGLQLSFAAVAGILLFAQKIHTPVASSGWYQALLKRAGAIRWLPETMLASFSCSIASMAFSLPLTAIYFGTVSLVAPIVNVLTLWAVTICFTCGIVITLLALVWTPLMLGPAWLLGWLARFVLWLAQAFSRLPFAAVYLTNAYWISWSVVLYGTVLLCLLLPKRPKLLPTAACLTLSLALTAALSYLDFHLPDFTFTALDVGQGQCLVYGCKDFTAVIDCGGSSPEQAGEDAARYLLSSGERRIDALVLTHYDEDHAGGAVQLLSRVKVKNVYLADTGQSPEMQARIQKAAQDAGSKVHLVDEDTLVSFSGGSMTVFAPVSERSSNESGICVLASAAEYDILVTGDLPVEAETALLRAHPGLGETELLVAGHHGSRTSTSYALLGRLRPQTVIVSVGENSYGHPADETLERIRKFGASVLRTDQCGTIVIRG